MTNTHTMHNMRHFFIVFAVFCALAVSPLLLSAQPSTSTSVNIVNNSNRTIRNVYLSHVGVDDWGGNQLGGTSISPGQSFTLSNITCDQQQIKVIGEDQDGCFLSTVVACGDSSTWTITNTTAADCGQ